MATTVAKLEAVLSADTRNFDRAMGRSQSRMGTIGKAAGIAGAALGGVLALGGRKAIKAASDLNEEIDKSEVVFGKASASVLKWSGGTASSLGLSQRMSLQAVGAYGNMFKTIGLGDKPAADMSRRMVTLAADMASFSNEDPSDMLLRLRGGLAGEAEPLRQFGVLLSEARVQQEAYRMGLAKVGEKLTEQQKVQARYSLIIKDSAVQHGNFALTADSAANRQRVLRAQVEDLSAKLGNALLPAFKAVLAVVIETVNFFSKHTTLAKVLAIGLGVLASALIAVSIATTLANLAFFASPIGLIVIGLAALVAGIVLAIKHWDKIKEKMLDVWDVIKGAVSDALNWVKEHWPEIATVLSGPFAPLVLLATDAFGVRSALEGAVTGIIDWITGKFNDILNAGKGLGGKLKEGAVAGITGIVGKIWDYIKAIWADWQQNAETIKGWGTSLGGWFKSAIIAAIVGVGTGIWEKLMNAWEYISTTFPDTIKGWGGTIGGWIKSNVIEGIVGVGTGIWEKLQAAWNWLKENAMDTIKGWGKQIGNWIKNAIVNALEDLGGAIWDAIKGAPGFIAGKITGDPKWQPPEPGPPPAGPTGPIGTYGLQSQTQGVLNNLNSRFNRFIVTSGFRTPAENARVHGAPNSDHLTGRAFDIVPSGGWTSANISHFDRIAAFASSLPIVRWVGWRGDPGHGPGDHLHVGTYDRGGFLRPGWNLAYNGLGRPEPVGAGTVNFNFPNYVGSKQELVSWLQNAAQEFKRRNRRGLT